MNFLPFNEQNFKKFTKQKNKHCAEAYVTAIFTFMNPLRTIDLFIDFEILVKRKPLAESTLPRERI